jgi:RNA recognition motif-containing protein
MQKLFIGNIPHTSSDEDLQKWVEGEGFLVESAQVIRDRSTRQSRGFAFVILKQDARIGEAISILNGRRMGGRALTVNRANPIAPRGRDASSVR